MEGLFRAIAFIHSLGYLHRDIKPENILLTTRDREKAIAKFADMGIARDVSQLSPTYPLVEEKLS